VGEKTVTIYFPWVTTAVIDGAVVDDDAVVELAKENKNLGNEYNKTYI